MTENGFMTERDRSYLTGETVYTGENASQMRYQVRRAIRERARAAFYDFALLNETLDDTEINQIFDPPQEEVRGLMESMVSTIAFMYRALEGPSGSQVPSNRSFQYPFVQVLEAGVRHGEIDRQGHNDPKPFGGRVEVTFEVDVTQIPSTDRARVIKDLAENQGKGLTDAELRAIITNAAWETTHDDEVTMTVNGEPVEEYVGVSDFGLRGLAEQVEQKAKELDEDSDDESDEE